MKWHTVLGVVSLLGLGFTLLACGGSKPSIAPTAIAYVAHSQSHSLSVIGIPAYKTLSTVEIGNSSTGPTPTYPHRVAVTPDGTRIYVTDANTSLWVVDARSNAVFAVIPAGIDPENVVISPDGKRAYVTAITCGVYLCSGPDNPPQMASVEVFDAATNAMTATITINRKPETYLAGIAISADGTRAYVADAAGNEVWVIDTATNAIVATIVTPSSFFVGVSVSPDGRQVYAAGWANGPTLNGPVVEVIDTATNVVSATVTLPSEEVPTQIAVTSAGNYAYVTGDGGHVWAMDTASDALAATISVSPGNPLLGIAMGPDGTRAYVTSGNNNTIYVLDTTTNTVVGKIPSDYPFGLAVTRAT